MTLVELAAGAAVWRVTHLLHAEDGPWSVFERLRLRARDGGWGEMLDCFYCLSCWTSVPFALALGSTWKTQAILWPALSGAAILLERITNPLRPDTPTAAWREDFEGEGT
jgi:hypothetical protein